MYTVVKYLSSNHSSTRYDDKVQHVFH